MHLSIYLSISIYQKKQEKSSTPSGNEYTVLYKFEYIRPQTDKDIPMWPTK